MQSTSNSQTAQRERWKAAMTNLIMRRGTSRGTQGESIEAIRIRDYRTHLTKVFIGKTLLDVGCGDMSIKKYLTDDVEYAGIDAFPIHAEVTKMEVEQLTFDDNSFDTIICFATLDGVCDLEKALQQMGRVCKKNIVFLTGIGIEPDEYHTYKINERIIMQHLPGFHTQVERRTHTDR